MTDANRIAMLEAQIEVIARDRDDARQMLREMGAENARLRALSLPADEPRRTYEEGWRDGVEATHAACVEWLNDCPEYGMAWHALRQAILPGLSPSPDTPSEIERVSFRGTPTCGAIKSVTLICALDAGHVGDHAMDTKTKTQTVCWSNSTPKRRCTHPNWVECDASCRATPSEDRFIARVCQKEGCWHRPHWEHDCQSMRNPKDGA